MTGNERAVRGFSDLDVHSLLARCETVAQATRLVTDHPRADGRWRRAWEIDMWRVEKSDLPAS